MLAILGLDLQPVATQVGSAAAIVGGLALIWAKGVRPVVRWGREMANLGTTLANLATPVDPSDPDSTPVIVAAVAQAVSVAEEVRNEAHAAAQAAEAAAALSHEAVRKITVVSEADQAAFRALAEWSKQFDGIQPLLLPAVPEELR